jgi:hypothetical protein
LFKLEVVTSYVSVVLVRGTLGQFTASCLLTISETWFPLRIALTSGGLVVSKRKIDFHGTVLDAVLSELLVFAFLPVEGQAAPSSSVEL